MTGRKRSRSGRCDFLPVRMMGIAVSSETPDDTPIVSSAAIVAFDGIIIVVVDGDNFSCIIRCC